MSTLPGPQQPKRQRKNALRIFYVFVFLTTRDFHRGSRGESGCTRGICLPLASFWLAEEFGVSFDS